MLSDAHSSMSASIGICPASVVHEAFKQPSGLGRGTSSQESDIMRLAIFVEVCGGISSLRNGSNAGKEQQVTQHVPEQAKEIS